MRGAGRAPACMPARPMGCDVSAVGAVGAAILAERPDLWAALADLVRARYALGLRAGRPKGSRRQPWAVARDLVVDVLTDAEAADLDALACEVAADPESYVTGRYQGEDGRGLWVRLDLCLRRRWRGPLA